MASIFLFASIGRNLRERARLRRVQQASAWPIAIATINSWNVLPLGDDATSFSQSDAIEAGFSFTLNGEYYGGYLRSAGMSHREAELLAAGSRAFNVNVRYNPANPDQVAVLAEDNATLPFQIVSG